MQLSEKQSEKHAREMLECFKLHILEPSWLRFAGVAPDSRGPSLAVLGAGRTSSSNSSSESPPSRFAVEPASVCRS